MHTLRFYQPHIVLIGAYLVYRNFFEKKPTLDSVIKKRDKLIPSDSIKTDLKWHQLSKDEKMEQFYDRFVDIIAIEKPIEPIEDSVNDKHLSLIQQQEVADEDP